jgi:glycosyltransferase involved in cell wall biosynthesis
VLQRSHHLLRETAKAHDVTLLSFIQRGHLARRFPTVERGLEEARAALSGFCRHVEFVPIPSENRSGGTYRLALKSLFTAAPYAINWLRSREFSRALQKILGAERFDLIHFDTISLAPYLRFLSGQKAVLDHHNIESHLMLRRAGQIRNPPKRLYYWLEGRKLLNYERKICPGFDAHITCSDLDSRRLEEIAPGVRAVEIPNGVDVGYFSPRPGQEQERTLVFAGGMNWFPNRTAILFFARAVWPLLKRDVPDVAMDVVGFDPPLELRELSRTDPSFRVHGFVDDVRPYLDRAAVYVCPISDGGGTKLKVLDAFAMAKATVAHPVACEGIAVNPDVDVVLASTPEEFAARIKFLFANPDARKRIGEAARNLILEKYTYDAIGKKLSRLYGDLVETGKPAAART